VPKTDAESDDATDDEGRIELSERWVGVGVRRGVVIDVLRARWRWYVGQMPTLD
jgi:hypothetical protein